MASLTYGQRDSFYSSLSDRQEEICPLVLHFVSTLEKKEFQTSQLKMNVQCLKTCSVLATIDRSLKTGQMPDTSSPCSHTHDLFSDNIVKHFESQNTIQSYSSTVVRVRPRNFFFLEGRTYIRQKINVSKASKDIQFCLDSPLQPIGFDPLFYLPTRPIR